MNNAKPIRVALIDDHQLVRAGIAALLRDLPEVEVVGEGASGEDAVRLAYDCCPDVMFLDLVMPGRSGLHVLPELRDRFPGMKVIVLSMHSSEEHVVRVLQLGAVGYMLKDVAPDELPLALAAVASGETWLSSAISRDVIDRYVDRNLGEAPLDILTARQREVLALLAKGYSTRDIATMLELSIKTIETFRAQIMERLNIHEVPGLVRYAILHGIVPL